MPLSDFDKILKEYQTSDNDFGFSAVSEKEYNEAFNAIINGDKPFIIEIISSQGNKSEEK